MEELRDKTSKLTPLVDKMKQLKQENEGLRASGGGRASEVGGGGGGAGAGSAEQAQKIAELTKRVEEETSAREEAEGAIQEIEQQLGGFAEKEGELVQRVQALEVELKASQELVATLQKEAKEADARLEEEKGRTRGEMVGSKLAARKTIFLQPCLFLRNGARSSSGSTKKRKEKFEYTRESVRSTSKKLRTRKQVA